MAVKSRLSSTNNKVMGNLSVNYIKQSVMGCIAAAISLFCIYFEILFSFIDLFVFLLCLINILLVLNLKS